jgi:hypothetical protein
VRDHGRSMPKRPSKVLEFGNAIGVRWQSIEQSSLLSQKTFEKLASCLDQIESPDLSVVVSGSLGRFEYTESSDIDWSLLADGIANPNHHNILLAIAPGILDIAGKKTGAERTFGQFVSSHDLIQKIGGEEDTNSNTTRRLLLLLESTATGHSVVFERVVRSILKRYLFDDLSFWRGTSRHKHHIPHFLLNDFARFWRTMSVDFAYKVRSRGGSGWAIRNIKLRMSRKLLYVAGLLACFRCHLDFRSGEERALLYTDPERRSEVIENLSSMFEEKPLGLIAHFIHERPHLHPIGSRLFGAYDSFLGLLHDSASRKTLEDLPSEDFATNETYIFARNLSHDFSDAILELFFDEKSDLQELTRLYGVF